MKRAIEEMAAAKAEEVVLEAEVTNKGALALYRNLGFLRDKRLLRYTFHGGVLKVCSQRSLLMASTTSG